MAESEALSAELKSHLAGLVGLPCWGYVAGTGTGSHFALDFGEKILREPRLSNPHLTQVQREYEAKEHLFITCVWRLDSADRVICGAWDSNEADGPMLAGLERIVGRQVTAVAAEPPGWDLGIQFGELTLRLFCDQVSEEDSDDNYSLFVPSGVITVGTRSRLRSHRQAR